MFVSVVCCCIDAFSKDIYICTQKFVEVFPLVTLKIICNPITIDSKLAANNVLIFLSLSTKLYSRPRFNHFESSNANSVLGKLIIGVL